MKNLLLDYRITLKETRSMLRDINFKILNLEKIENIQQEEKNQLIDLNEDKRIINSWISNLEYSINWMKTGRRPQSTRGVERRSAYEKEVPFDNRWIQNRINNDANNEFARQIDMEELAGNETYKIQLVCDVTKTLTDKQQEMLELSANGYSHAEIANILGIKKGTVDTTISRSKKKIEDEGWFMM